MSQELPIAHAAELGFVPFIDRLSGVTLFQFGADQGDVSAERDPCMASHFAFCHFGV